MGTSARSRTEQQSYGEGISFTHISLEHHNCVYILQLPIAQYKPVPVYLAPMKGPLINMAVM